MSKPGPAHEELRENSPAWKALATAAVLIGVPGGFFALAGLLQVDNTATAVHASITQDVIGISAVVICIGMWVGGIYLAVRWGRRPGAMITPAGVVAYNWRPLLVPWSMISSVTTIRRIARKRRPALVLIGGDVVRLRFAPQKSSWSRLDGRKAGRWAVADLVGQALRDQRPGWSAEPRGPDVPAPVPGRLLQRDLPGVPVARLASLGFPSQLRFLLLLVGVPAAVGLLGVQRGHRFVLAQYLLGIAAFIALGYLIIAVQWARWVRVLAFGSDWVAWKPRGARRWRVLPFSRLASIAPGIDVSIWGQRRQRGARDGQRPPGRDSVKFGLTGPASADVAVRRPDGWGIRLRPYELANGVGRAFLQVAGDSPAMTDLARQQLDWYARVRIARQSPAR